ncbi:MAG: flagellar basal body P-ring formation chaperone FlgA [Planctomycetes bacterium]|nr:flagellar basal body P-ring formation chaperone FlgA [Planctomycetota bacterium]
MQASISFTFVMLVMLLAGTAASAATEIRVRENTVVENAVVRLGDVAEISSNDEQQTRRLAAIPLMPAPVDGSQRFLRKREIEDLLAAHGVDLPALAIRGAAQVTVTGSRARAGAGEIDMKTRAVLRDGVRSLIANYLHTKTGDAGDWTVMCDVAERHLTLLQTATTRPTCVGGTAPWLGRQRFVILFATANGPTQFPVYAEITPPSVPVVVALVPLNRGDVITAADLELQNVDEAPKSNGRRVAAQSVESLIGMEARQPIPAGSILFTDSVQSPVLVKRGDLITVSSQGSGIRVRTTARARQDGSHGQLVQVESLETKESFDVRVVGAREAAIVAVSTTPKRELARPIETARR